MLALADMAGTVLPRFRLDKEGVQCLDRYLINDGLSNTILTLPQTWQQQEILLAWFNCLPQVQEFSLRNEFVIQDLAFACFAWKKEVNGVLRVIAIVTTSSVYVRFRSLHRCDFLNDREDRFQGSSFWILLWVPGRSLSIANSQ
ncbi:hypothetical protein NE237_030578 [Protea cynaroides]|uniref:Uncharacterized protein n=1 Tax=Protea cynaroides TaxID=273540 RepID=A0A9Q0JVX4_9MAGN|nr:hypothetical protein NE237_030578 [Protea cynaroides]